MDFLPTPIPGLTLIRPKVHADPRGFFLETYSLSAFKSFGIDAAFVQDNHSRSLPRGVLRGLHFQAPPFEQAKLVRVVRGAAFDVAVDLRSDSPTYKRWAGFELTEDNFDMLFIPRGFAHGFYTLVEGTEVVYKVDNPYSAGHDGGVVWDDPDLGVEWPISGDGLPILSDKDRGLPRLSNLT